VGLVGFSGTKVGGGLREI